MLPADEDVGDVDVGGAVLRGGSPFQIVGDDDSQVGTLFGFFFPSLVAIDVGEGEDLPSLQDLNPVVELSLAAGGEPDPFGTEDGADNGCFLCFDEDNRFVGVSLE